MIKASKNLLVKIYNLLFVSNYNNKYKSRRKYILWLVCNIGDRLAECLIRMYVISSKPFHPTLSPLSWDGKLIVSLTSFPARIDKVWITIDSLMRQTVRPSKICLYLSDEEFPYGRESLPRRLFNYERLGLEICFRPHNLRPHNKYFYALQEHPSCDVITVDDDKCYFSDMIERLVRLHEVYPACICSNAIDMVVFRPDGTPLPGKSWPRSICPVEPLLTNVALGYSGVYYPAGIFKKQLVFDMDDIRLLALRTDDLWLRIHETLEGIPVAGGGYNLPGLTIIGSQRIALMSINCTDKEDNGNDVAWKKLCNHYGVAYDYHTT